MDLAAKVGIHLMTLSSWERIDRGDRLPRADLLRTLADELDVDFAWLAFGDYR